MNTTIMAFAKKTLEKFTQAHNQTLDAVLSHQIRTVLAQEGVPAAQIQQLMVIFDLNPDMALSLVHCVNRRELLILNAKKIRFANESNFTYSAKAFNPNTTGYRTTAEIESLNDMVLSLITAAQLRLAGIN